MQTKDWLERWQKDHIGFHEGSVNTHLEKHISDFNLNSGDRIFMPLCGKAHDIAWLAKQGFEVIGIEIAGMAIEAFFSEFNMQYQQFQSDRFIMRKSGNIMLFEGDYFDLQSDDLADCKLVYDRAALIAIDESNRARYCSHMQAIAPANCDMLLVTLDYDQAQMSGPPFSVPQDEVFQHYQSRYQIEALEKNQVVDEQPRWRKQGLTSLMESSYRLKGGVE
jgi:thiopurine S-methyltransferase